MNFKKRFISILALPLMIIIFASCSKQTEEEKKLGIEDGHYRIPLNVDKPENFDDKLSYSMAYELAENWGEDSLNLSINYIVRAIADSKLKREPLLSEEERYKAKAEFENYQIEMQKLRKQKGNKILQKRGESNKLEEPKFLAEYKTKTGVQTTESGMMYLVLQEGEGDSPKMEDYVSVHMTGQFRDGIQFEDTKTVNGGVTVKIPLGRMNLEGWKEAVSMMKKGSKWEIVLPSKLAYGEEGMPPTFPPYSTLIFQIELVDFGDKDLIE